MKIVLFLFVTMVVMLQWTTVQSSVLPPCEDPDWYCRYKARAENCKRMDECFPPAVTDDSVTIVKVTPTSTPKPITLMLHTYFTAVGR